MTLSESKSLLGSFVPQQHGGPGPALYHPWCRTQGFMLHSFLNVYLTVTTVPTESLAQLLQIPKYQEHFPPSLSLSLSYSHFLSLALSLFSLFPCLWGQKKMLKEGTS